MISSNYFESIVIQKSQNSNLKNKKGKSAKQ